MNSPTHALAAKRVGIGTSGAVHTEYALTL